LHGDGLLKLNNCQNWKKKKKIGFLNFSPLARFGNMEPIHVKESFKIFMNEKKIALEEKIEEENYDRPKTLPNSQL
jgi:hypothetical protein